jgi:hypothetical protein
MSKVPTKQASKSQKVRENGVVLENNGEVAEDIRRRNC